MRARLIAIIASLLLLPIPASAIAPGDTVYTTCTITTAAATTCLASGAQPQYLVGVVNNSTAAQTATLTCYDNATAASGTVAASIGALAASAVVSWPSPGKRLANGLTCIASGAPTASGFDVYVR